MNRFANLAVLVAVFFSSAAPAADWAVEGRYAEACDCAVPCPCWNSKKPEKATHDECKNLILFHIDKGHLGKVSLDGVDVAELVLKGIDGKTFDQALDEGGMKRINFYFSKSLTPEVARAAEELFTQHLSFAPPAGAREHAVKHVDLRMKLDALRATATIPTVLTVDIAAVEDDGQPRPFIHEVGVVKFLSAGVQGKTVRYEFHDDGQQWNLSGTHGLFARLAFDSNRQGALPWEKAGH